MRRLFDEGMAFVLCAIVDSSGSTPRGAGALMLASQEGRVWGSIGGAEAEYLALENAKTLISQKRGFSLEKFILNAVNGDTGMPQSQTLLTAHPSFLPAVCGGEILVFSRCIDSASPGLLDFIEKGMRCFSENENTWLSMEIAANGENNSTIDRSLSLCLLQKSGALACMGTAPPNAAEMLATGPGCFQMDNNTWFSMPLCQDGFVYVFGGGHVAQELVPLLSRLDFRVIVFDDRKEFTRQELFPDAVKIITGNFSCIGDNLELSAHDYAVIVTRGHSWDFQAESFALKSSAAYIGVIGSKSKHAHIEGHLLSAGFSGEEIHAPRVHAPIGIAIGSKTPAEVAVSIAAELIYVRAVLAKD